MRRRAPAGRAAEGTPGCAADLVLVEQDGRWPRVVGVLASPCGQEGLQDARSAFTVTVGARGRG